MAVFKCKMCGGTLDVNEGDKITMCAYCGNRQTVPTVSDDAVANQFNRANYLRMRNEFDKAAEAYGKILDLDDKISEAHWGLVLCKYGVEYVEDPKTFRRIPTCHRTQYVSILADADYLAAIDNADESSAELYTAQAHEIAELQKSILAIVKDEKPFDVFICYKETDEEGKRTVDSTVANDIYYQLTKEGMRVFYAAITLEDKLGVEYEPYIFAALNTAKVMLVIGTRPEYFNAVWVKNEWSRYLGIMKNDREKMLIPCYRDMDAYDLPEEFAHLQAQDMAKIGFINDLVRGIKKVTGKNVVAATENNVVGGINIPVFLKRAFMFLEDKEWRAANEYAEKILDTEPENVPAYLVKLMADTKSPTKEELRNSEIAFEQNNNYKKILRFGNEELVREISGYCAEVNNRKELERLTAIYDSAVAQQRIACSEPAYIKAAELFSGIVGFRDAQQCRDNCLFMAMEERNKVIYNNAVATVKGDRLDAYEKALEILAPIAGWKESGGTKDADALITLYTNNKENLQKRIKKAQIKEKTKKLVKLLIILAIIGGIGYGIYSLVTGSDADGYESAMSLYEDGRYAEAAVAFGKLGDYKDSYEKSKECWAMVSHDVVTFDANFNHTVAITEDGSVVVTNKNALFGKPKYIDDWENISAVSAGSNYVVGLTSEKKVVYEDYSEDKGKTAWLQAVEDWENVKFIDATRGYMIGLTETGNILFVGDDKEAGVEEIGNEVSYWENIVSVSAGKHYVVGIKTDGTVIAAGSNEYGGCDVSDWEDIVAVSVGAYHTVGLKSDGTVVVTGDQDRERANVSSWTNIVRVEAGNNVTVGIKADGKVLAVGATDDGRLNVDKWDNIVAVSADDHVVGLTSDGKLVATGKNDKGQCEVSKWPAVRLT